MKKPNINDHPMTDSRTFMKLDGSVDWEKKIKIFVNRLKKLGIEVKLAGNYPWIYLDKINGKAVTEKFQANHGFTIAFLPIRKNQELKFTDISEIFKLIRKYV